MTRTPLSSHTLAMCLPLQAVGSSQPELSLFTAFVPTLVSLSVDVPVAFKAVVSHLGETFLNLFPPPR